MDTSNLNFKIGKKQMNKFKPYKEYRCGAADSKYFGDKVKFDEDAVYQKNKHTNFSNDLTEMVLK